jgi:cell division protein ZapA (FtsZ GTPase activity inhibitor)
MSKKQTEKTITINDKEYKIEDMNDEQIGLLNHINDLDRKIGSSQFNLQQLSFGKEAFVNALAASLEVEMNTE